MVVAAFVAPSLLDATARFVEAAVRLPGMELAVITCEPADRLPSELRRGLAAHFRIDDALDAGQIAGAVQAIGNHLGPVQRLLAVLEQLQVPLAQVREQLGIAGIDVETARNFRDKAQMKSVLRAAGMPCARHRLADSAAAAADFAEEVGFPLVVKPPAGAGAKSTFRLDDADDLRVWLEAAPPAPDRLALLEEFLSGEEGSYHSVMPPLAADLNAGLRRLKLAAMRRLAPELLVTARTQRWNPEEFLRTLIDAEVTSLTNPTPAPGCATPRSRSPRPWPSSTSPHPRSLRRPSTTSRRWNGSGPRRMRASSGRPLSTGQSHVLVALGVAAVHAGHRVRHFTAAELVETLYRALADNSVGRVIDTLLRHDLIICDELGFAPLDDTGAQLLFRFVAAAYERRALGIGSHWPFESWGRFLPEHTTAVSMLDRLLHHCHVVVSDGDSYRMK
jgi:hypothetical protein